MSKFSRNRLRVRFFQALAGVATLVQKLPARMTPPPFRLMQIGSAFWQSRALYVATRLGLADVLADGHKSTRDIAVELQLNEDHLYRLMRMLASIGIFEEMAPRVFRNSGTSGYLRRDNPKNVRAMILMHNSPEMTQPWLEPLEQSMRDGGVPFIKSHGVGLFDYMDRTPEFDTLFSDAMDCVENLTGNAYLDDFDWSAFERVIDVGGSRGSKAASILKVAPALTAVVFDRPQVIEAARDYWQQEAAAELVGRLDFEAGDMFEQLPAAVSGRDLYLFVAVFHGLSDEEACSVLDTLRAAIGATGASVLIVDCIANEVGIDPVTAGFDMQMLICTRGHERTPNEWKSLLEKSGFRLEEIVPVRTFAKFIVARPGQDAR